MPTVRTTHYDALGRPSVVCWYPGCPYESPSGSNVAKHVLAVHGADWWYSRRPGWSSPSGRTHKRAGGIRTFAALEVPVAEPE